MSQIEKILNNEYGVGIAIAPPVAVLWAAEKCEDPKKSLKTANRIRAKHGMPLAHAPYGHAAF
jgi:hypothetical protein